jgi:hypothetical protein
VISAVFPMRSKISNMVASFRSHWQGLLFWNYSSNFPFPSALYSEIPVKNASVTRKQSSVLISYGSATTPARELLAEAVYPTYEHQVRRRLAHNYSSFGAEACRE